MRKKTKLPVLLNEHQVNWWLQLANKLNKEEIQLLQTEIQKGLELAIEEKKMQQNKKKNWQLEGNYLLVQKYE